MISLLFLFATILCKVSAYEISIRNSHCEIVQSRIRGLLIKFHVEGYNPKCKGKVRFKQQNNNTTYCLPIVDGKRDILSCHKVNGFCQAQARLRLSQAHSGSVRLKLRLSDSDSVTVTGTQSLG